MKALLEAIITYWATLGLAASLDLYYDEAPQNTAYPFATFFIVTNAQDDDMTERAEVTRVQFNVWTDDSSPSQCVEYADTLKVGFDWTTFAVAGYSNVYCKRLEDHLVRSEDGGWQYVIDYEIHTQET